MKAPIIDLSIFYDLFNLGTVDLHFCANWGGQALIGKLYYCVLTLYHPNLVLRYYSKIQNFLLLSQMVLWVVRMIESDAYLSPILLGF